MAKYAYARALQKGQSLNKQIQSFSQFGVPKGNIFTDEQPNSYGAYGELLQILKRGDLLVIKSLSALGDGYGGIATEWSRITSTLGVDICVLDMPALDTRLGSSKEVVSSAVIQILNFCNERARKQSTLQAKGIQAAKQRGVKFGRPAKNFPETWPDDYAAWQAGEVTAVSLYKKYGMSCTTFYSNVKKWEQEHNIGHK